MSVYVGIDVHRKRSRLTVIDAAGEVLANRNVPNGVEPILTVIGGLPPATPAAFEAAFGTGWLAGAAGGLRLRPAPGAPVAVQGDRLRAAEERQGPAQRSWRSCCARTCCRRRGVAPPAVRQLRALLRHRVQLVRLRTLLRNRTPRRAGRPRPRPAGRVPGAGRAGNGWPRCRCPPPPARWSMTAWR